MIRLAAPLRPLVRAAGRIFALWLRSLRVRVQLPDGTSTPLSGYRLGDALYAFSERDLVAVAGAARDNAFIVLADEGADADWAIALASGLRCEFVRGSTLHHGLGAARDLISILGSTDRPAAIVVDGPVGPAGEAKPGIAACAALTGRRIVPAAAAATPRIVFPGSWARHYLPLPWSRVAIALGEPLTVTRDATRSELDAVARSITIALRELSSRAELDLHVRTKPVESVAT